MWGDVPVHQFDNIKKARFNPAVIASMTKQIRQIQKAELHLHLGGAWPLSYLKTIADDVDYQRLVQFIQKLKNETLAYDKCFELFSIIKKIVKTDKHVEDGVVALCKQLAADNVAYAEVRTGIKDLGGGNEGYLSAIIRGIEKGCRGKNLTVKLILSVRRDTDLELAEQTVSLAKKHFYYVVGLDVSGNVLNGDGSQVYSILRDSGLPIVLHLGESPKETVEQQMVALKELEPKRIGHAVHLHPKAHSYICRKKIPIELCLSSAVFVQMITDWNLHPAVKLFKNGHPVVACTDDPLMFGTSLSKEFALASHASELEYNDVLKMNMNAFNFKLVREG